MKTKLILVLFVLLAAISCEQEEDSYSFDFRVENSFKVFNEYTSTDQSFSFSILEVLDSRCPEGVTCFWQGEATVRIRLENSVADTLELSTYDNVKDTLNNYSIELLDVSPYPNINKKVEQDDYRVTLLVSKLD